MDLRYLRVATFVALKNPFSDWARQRRMQQMIGMCEPRPGISVLDLGGKPGTWNHPSLPPMNITILNLPGNIEVATRSQHSFSYLEGDACDVVGIASGSFDFVFSNSVIEHVGGPARRQTFANEVRRIGRSYWVQTPSIWFPIEAHCGMPLWWFYPDSWRGALIERWRRKLPAWTEMVEGTTVVKRSEMESLFPEATVLVERVLGIPKSYIVVRTAKNSAS
jgi:Methyltransferase domain